MDNETSPLNFIRLLPLPQSGVGHLDLPDSRQGQSANGWVYSTIVSGTYKTKLKLDREVGGGDLSELRNCKRLINKLTEVLIRLMWLI